MKPLSSDQIQRSDLEAVRVSPKLPVTVVLDNIRSGLNVGAIFRTCDAFAIERMILCGITVTPPHAEIMKTALGATESVPWTYSPSTREAVAGLAESGYTCLPVEHTSNARLLDDATRELPFPLALIFGNEMRGVHPEVLAICPYSLEIPQSGIKHSLNVATAAGIVLWECYRLERRRLSPG